MFQNQTDFQDFSELFQMYAYSLNSLMEFAHYLKNQFLFPRGPQKPQEAISIEEFKNICAENSYIFVSSDRIRKKYTEFVYAVQR